MATTAAFAFLNEGGSDPKKPPGADTYNERLIFNLTVECDDATRLRTRRQSHVDRHSIAKANSSQSMNSRMLQIGA